MGVLGAWFMGILEGSGMQDSEGHLILEHKGRYETVFLQNFKNKCYMLTGSWCYHVLY